MNVNDYVRAGITDLMTNAAKLAADAFDDPDFVAAMPMAFFQAGEALWKAWLIETEQIEDGVI